GNLESLQALRRLVEHLDLLDVGAARAALAPTQHRLDRRRPALERGFDRAVRTIPDPPCYAPGAGCVECRVAEADALHEPAHDDAPPDLAHASAVSCSTSSQKRATSSSLL